jgi:hypothetical protein
VFDGAWGSEPITTFVPDTAGWDYLPDWLRHRRDLVLQRLRDCADHVVIEDPDYTDGWRRGQRHYTSGEVTRDQKEARFLIADKGTNKRNGRATAPEPIDLSPPLSESEPALPRKTRRERFRRSR